MLGDEPAAFLTTAAILCVTPGADMALVTRNAIRSGRPGALATTAGITVGLAIWVVASGIGLAAVLTASQTAFDVLRYAGAAYLVYLGLQALGAARSGAAVEEYEPAISRGRSPFLQGLLTNLLNPKIAAFFTSFLPQFISPGDDAFVMSVVLGGIFALMGLVWLVLYGAAVAGMRDLVRRPVVNRALNALSGIALVGIGVRLAFSRAG